MKRVIGIGLVILVIIAVLFSWYYYEKESEDRDFITLYGNVDVRQVDLGFRVSGRTDKMYFEEGNLVPAGKLMAYLDKQPYADQVVQAEAQVASSLASYKNAELLLKRRQELIKDGSVAQEDVENAVAAMEVYAANLKASKAALAIAETNLSFTELYAPADGVILTRIREPGTVVQPADPIYTLSLVSPVWIRAFVSEQNLGLIYPDMPAEIYTDTPGSPVYKGHIGFISPVSEFTPKTVETTQLRTDLVYRLRVIADNPDRGLRQGMPVTVKLHLKHSAKQLRND